MALQLRRGLSADRTSITPATGELIYTTDTKLVYVGDGTTAGGNALGGGGGLTDIVTDTSPQLGGNLDVNGFNIVSTSNADIRIEPNGTGQVVFHGNLSINANGNFTKTGEINFAPTTFTSFGNNSTLVDGNIIITRNSYSSSATAGLVFSQSHNTPDAVNFNFFRTRGSALSPVSVNTGDELGEILFTGFNGTTIAPGAQLTVTVESSPSATSVPSKFVFATHNGTGFGSRAELSSLGVWKVNSIQNLSGTDLNLTATNVKVAGDLQINAQGDLRFADSDNSNYVAFQAPASVVSNVTWTLPAADGTSGDVLTTNGAGTLSWTAVSGGITSTGIYTAAAFRAKTFTQLDSSGTAVGTITHTSGVTLNNAGIHTLRFDSASFDIHSDDVVIGNDTVRDGRVTVQTNGADTKTLSLKSYNSSATSGTLSLFKARGTKSTPTPISLNDKIYNIAFEAWSGTSTLVGAKISAEVTASPGLGLIPSDLVFETTDTLGVSNVVGRFTNAGVFKVQEVELQTARLTTATSVLALRTTNGGSPVINIRCTNNGNVEVSNLLVAANTISPTTTNANLTLAGNGTGHVAVTGDVVASGTVTASSFTSTAVGTPTMTSATDIRLEAAGVVHVTQTPFRLASFTSSEILTLSPVNGDLIYNSTTSKVQAYAGGTWVDLH